MLDTFVQGFFVSGALIVAIGAQNAFVLKQGLRRNHVFWVCLTCFLCDFTLMMVGVLGLGALINQSVTAQVALAAFGALFLLWYGVNSLRSAFKGEAMQIDEAQTRTSLKQTLAMTFALTLLNPHVYLDTVVLIGGIAGTLTASEKMYFLFGAWGASLLWFFGLGYGARLLIPLFKKPLTWKILDIVIAIIMFLIALTLIQFILEKVA